MWPVAPYSFSGMTAISVIYTKPGFVLAADGFARFSDPAKISDTLRAKEKDDQQKLFRVKHGKNDIAFAITGSVFNEDGSFSLIAQAQKAFRALSRLNFNNTQEFVDSFAYRFKKSVENASAKGIIDQFEVRPNCIDPVEAATFAKVFIVGYSRDTKPFLGVVRLFHDNQILADPAITVQIPPEHNMFSGSREIAKRLFERLDQRLDKYYRYADLNSSFGDAVACAKGYIEACSDPVALEIDPKQCQGIGGHIHIAAVTPEGFQWIEPPKGLS